jgi:hypothetical protein
MPKLRVLINNALLLDALRFQMWQAPTMKVRALPPLALRARLQACDFLLQLVVHTVSAGALASITRAVEEMNSGSMLDK